MRRFEYSAIFDRLEETLAGQVQRVSEERMAVPALLAELMGHAEEDRRPAALAERKFHTYALVCGLLDRSEKALVDEPQVGLEVARLARMLASRIDPRTCGGTAALADVEAFALALEASALRLQGNLALCEELFGGVRAILEQGGADLYLNARTDFLEALLWRDLGDVEAAHRLAGRALRALVSLGERDRARALYAAAAAGVPLHLLTPSQGSPTAVH